MATLVKEKKRERKTKKKSDKNHVKLKEDDELLEVDISAIPSCSDVKINAINTLLETKETSPRSVENETSHVAGLPSQTKNAGDLNLGRNSEVVSNTKSITSIEENVAQYNTEITTKSDTDISYKNLNNELELMSPASAIQIESNAEVFEIAQPSQTEENVTQTNTDSSDTFMDFKSLSHKLELMWLRNPVTIEECQEEKVEHPDAYLQLEATNNQTVKPALDTLTTSQLIEPALEATSSTEIEPSAPIIDLPKPNAPIEEKVVEIKSKLNCMTLEEAIEYYNGKIIAGVKSMSKREAAIVEAGPLSGPDHPLVDLLTTFRTSIMALERSRVQLENSYDDEKKFRNSLWITTKKIKHLSATCQCGDIVKRKISYDYSEFNRNKLPVAKMKLEKFTRDVQECYCHYQYVAMKTFNQIEIILAELVCEEISDIREGLFLILQALKLSSGAPDVLSSALLRWAVGLACNLVGDDISDLLFLLHLLFRQSRSVRWASHVINVLSVQYSKEAAHVLTLLDILLNYSKVESAVECNEDLESSESWEELGMGGAGAVSEGTLRERDLLALVNALPLTEMIAKILMFNDNEFSSTSKEYWGDSTGGKAMLTSCCGVRTLISCLRARPHYATLRARLRQLAAAALKGLACLYQSHRKPYLDEYKKKILGEMEACFSAGFTLFDKEDLTSLPASLLTDDTARDYCLSFIVGLHEKVPKRIESLEVDMPVLPCEMRVRIVTQAAVDRVDDHELARMVLDFLFQVGIKKKIETCNGGCDAIAKQCFKLLLEAHMYLLPIALRIMADICQVEQLDPESVKLLLVDKWRPRCEDMEAVLQDWSQRCPLLLPKLLLIMDYTPPYGVSLPTQLHIADWLRKHPLPISSEWRWTVLRSLRLHRLCWALSLDDAPALENEPKDLFDKAYALLATSWGHSIPLVCSVGVSALLDIVRARPVDGAYVTASIMLVMTIAVDSIPFTPQFAEIVSRLGSQSPSLLSRAFGRGGASGNEILQRMIIAQVEDPPELGEMVFSAWLSAGWARALREGAGPTLAALDTAALIARAYSVMDIHAQYMLQAGSPQSLVQSSVRSATSAPLLCEVLLRAWHSHYEVSLLPALRTQLALQKRNGSKIHVDNALQKIGSWLTMEELTIYRAAAAGVAAPPPHPAHLLLWRLFFHIYLQRTMDPVHPSLRNPTDCDVALGPLFFSGIRKSRTLLQIKKKLQETLAYHSDEASSYKNILSNLVNNTTSEIKRTEKKEDSTSMFPPLLASDLTDEKKKEIPIDSDDEEDGEGTIGDESRNEQIKQLNNMIDFHTQAQRLVTEYIGWLEAGENVVASPHHADLARLIPDTAIEEAWKLAVSKLRPTPSPELDNFPKGAPLKTNSNTKQNTPFDTALEVINATKVTSRNKRWEVPNFESDIQYINVDNKDEVIDAVKNYFIDIDHSAEKWSLSVNYLVTKDLDLWKNVERLKESKPIPPIKAQCANKCKEKVVLVVNENEYVTNTAAARMVEENRSLARQKICELCKAKPYLPRAVASLQTLVRCVTRYEIAYRIMVETWRHAAACDGCSILEESFLDIFTYIVQRFILSNRKLCADLITQWCGQTPVALQQTLVGALVAPTDEPCGPLYSALLHAGLPHHHIFSCLSKFEMGKIMEKASRDDRREFMLIILKAAARYGADPPETYHMVLELLGVHAGHVVTSQLLPEFVTKICEESNRIKMPPSFWIPMNNIANNLAEVIEFDQLGHLLRTMGSVWKLYHKDSSILLPYALHVASLLQTLVSAFVKAGIGLSYEPSRVGWYAWGALLEAWTPWIAASGPLAFMLQHFVDAIHQIMIECPGSEVKVLQLVFEWAMQIKAQPPILVELKRLPWDEHQWVSLLCIQVSLQLSSTSESEVGEWINDRWRCTTADTLVKLVALQQLPAHLANLLHLFTTTTLTEQVIEEGTRLPWWYLPDQEFGQDLDKFFHTYQNPTVPYHEIPQFKMLLYASEIKPQSSYGSFSGNKRARLVSAWSAAILASQRTHLKNILQLFNELAPHLIYKDEMINLVSRAMITLCSEPAASEAIQLWCDWVTTAGSVCVRATVVSSASLTVAKYSATLADVAVKTILNKHEEGWPWLVSVWRSASWRHGTTYVCRGAPHAAYCCVLADPHPHTHPPHIVATLNALTTSCKINFVEDEVIVAVWICYACRIGYECLRNLPPDQSTQDFPLPAIDVNHPDVEPPSITNPVAPLVAARILLRTLSAQPKRSLLKFITLKVDTDVQTPQHRLLATFALCIIEFRPEYLTEFSSQCSSVLGANNQFSSWGKDANLGQLLALASHLYPNKSKYFHIETENVKRIEGNVPQ